MKCITQKARGLLNPNPKLKRKKRIFMRSTEIDFSIKHRTRKEGSTIFILRYAALFSPDVKCANPWAGRAD